MLGIVLFRVLAGRWAEDRTDAVRTAGVIGGTWPIGADAVVRLCCRPEAEEAAPDAATLVDRVEPLLALGRAVPVGARAAVATESVTGWRKAQGRTIGDNEDVIVWDRVAKEDLVLAVHLADFVDTSGRRQKSIRLSRNRSWV